MRKFKFLAVTMVMVLAVMTVAPAFAAPPAAITFPDPAMEAVWNRTDQPVASLQVARTWIWGPEMFNTRQEAYAESPGGQRLVAYFDKSRMEITNPNADRDSQWFVTNGLLARELVSGQVQVGDAKFENRAPAQIPVAGDPDDTTGPTYAAFTNILGRPAHNVGDQLLETIDRDGKIGTGGPGGVTAVYFVSETNHTVASVFWDFLNSTSTVVENGRNVQAKLFDPTFFAVGFPISEAYWAQVKVAGQTQWVLIQAFERRVLTYTPDNPSGWKVEMGNIGRHYYNWRYNNVGAPTFSVPQGWTVLDDTANGYKSGVPQGWTGIKAGTPQMAQFINTIRQANPAQADNLQNLINSGLLKSVAFDPSQATADKGFSANFNVVREPLQQAMSLDEYVAAGITELGQLGIPKENISQEKMTTTYGQFAVLKYQVPVQGTDTKLSFTQYIGVWGNAAYTLTVTTTANQAANYANLIQQLGLNFQIGL